MKYVIISILLSFLIAMIFKTVTGRLNRAIRQSVQDLYYSQEQVNKSEVLFKKGEITVMKETNIRN